MPVMIATFDNFSCISLGLGLGDILKPDLIMPLMETLPLEQRLAPYLPEVDVNVVIEFYYSLSYRFMQYYLMQGKSSPEEILELLQSPPFRQQVDSFTYVRIQCFTYLILHFFSKYT